MPRFVGIFTPLITPITADECPDTESLARLVRFQLAGGVHGLWGMGTTSEFASFAADERARALECTLEAANGQVPTIANISDASTRLAIRHARRAAELGANAVAATPPYYYPHAQDELIAHYRAIRDAVDLPLFIYNIPQTVRVRVELSTATTLAAERTVAGIKDSQNDLEWFRQLALFTRQEGLPFALFAGTRSLIDAAVVAGATGAIPSLANAFPALCVSAFELATQGNFQDAAQVEAQIVAIESAAGLAAGGSRNAAIISLLKTILQRRGVIRSAAVTSPLRGFTEAETHLVWERAQAYVPVE